MKNLRMMGLSTVAVGVVLAGAACSSSGSSTAASGSTSSPMASSSSPMASSGSSGMASGSSSQGTMSADFGPACSTVPKSGAGSFTGMSTAPVATAASANPVLSTLVTAVKKADLVDTLNSAKNITVFAPANSAFAKVPSATLNSLLANKAMLTKVLTYHVVGSKVTPAQLASGTPLKTLEGGTVTGGMSGGNYTVNGADVVCGNVQTANATVYIISSVLMPK